MFQGKYKLLGIEELNWICDFCGKKKLEKVYTVEDIESGEILRFGSSCIKKALKISTSDITIEIKKEAQAIKDKYKPMIHSIERKSYEIMEEYRRVNNYNRGFLPDSCTEYWSLINKASRLNYRMFQLLSKYGYQNFYNNPNKKSSAN